jgi:hypothetical protein
MVVDVTQLFDANELLEREITLGGVVRNNDKIQLTITIPSDFARVCGWMKGDVLIANLILGSGLICLSKKG